MRFVAAAILFLTPLALAPGWFFYYDITPKVCLLYLGAAVLAALGWFLYDGLHSLRASALGRWYIGLMVAMATLAAIAAYSSPQPELAWSGSNWRRGGALTEIATVTAALLIAAGASASRDGLFATLRATCAAGCGSSAYGIAQYFGWDPWIPKSAYHVGEGIYEIVRPTSTLGHSDYFSAFLMWPVFFGAALWKADLARWRWLGAAATVLGAVAVVLSGSRGALLGLAVGAVGLAWMRRISPRAMGTALAGVAVAAGLFYISPAGARLRARVFWISEDLTGGARLLLWRDSLRMAAAAPIRGYGPDAFAAEFPKFQSRELSRAYPDFYHESPHNIFLDALTAEGAGGFALLLGITAIGLAAGLRRWREDPLTAAMCAALIGAVVAQQFIVFVTPTALAFLVGVGLLVRSGKGDTSEPSSMARIPVAVVGVALAAVFLWTAHRVGSGDRALAKVEQALKEGKVESAAAAYRSAEEHRATGVTADLTISRLAASAAARAREVPVKLVFAQIAASSGVAATRNSEQRQNAWYNLAVMQAGSNDAREVEASLRAAIASSPNWYKPHWMLARVLAAGGRADEARREAGLALDLDGGKHAEVTQTLESVVRSAAP